MSGIYVIAAELSGPFSSHPTMTLREMMSVAASRAIARADIGPDEVDALYAGAMGNFDPEGFIGPIPIRVNNALGLRNAEITPMLVGSSEAGAWALRQAYEAMKHDPSYKRVLVVAGEQMNPLTGAAAPADEEAGQDQRRRRNEAISEILDGHERQYGLNMVRAGDLVMDRLAVAHGWSLADLREVFLPLVAMTKYRRVAGYPFGQLHGRAPLTRDEYAEQARLTRYFNMHDVTPTSSGAVALVLSSEPVGAALEILGMGQAIVPISMAARSGDPIETKSIRRAITKACIDAQVDTDWLLSCDFALLHDAFVSIEYAFLAELGVDVAEITRRTTDGWSNPFGGLKTCGHALGASGLLQVAKAHQRIFRDRRYLTESAISSFDPAERCFTTSVGGPLTNVVVSLLQRAGATPTPADPGNLTAYSRRTETPDPHYELLRGSIPPGHGMVVCRTHIVHNAAFGDDSNPLFDRVREPWIGLLERSPADSALGPKTFAFSDRTLEVGEVVPIENVEIAGASYSRAGPPAARHVLDAGRAARGLRDLVEALRKQLIGLE
jgi:acetyl-CoA acetyltransferase